MLGLLHQNGRDYILPTVSPDADTDQIPREGLKNRCINTPLRFSGGRFGTSKREMTIADLAVFADLTGQSPTDLFELIVKWASKLK